MKTLGPLVAALFLLTACGDKSDDVPLDDLVPDATVAPVSDLAFEDADWEGWQPVYGAMRPADAAAVAEIAERVTDLNASSWTAHESTTDAEISYTPEHVRLRSDYLDLHLTPDLDLLASDMTACTDQGCSALDASDEEDTEAEALAQGVRSPFFVLPMQLGLVEEIEEPLDEGTSAISTVDSPAGPVDCLVVGEEQRDVDDLVGQPVEVDADGRTFVGWCVDPRGLVLVGYSDRTQVPLFDAWRSGVDDQATELVPAPEVSEAVDPTGDYEDVVWATWHGQFRDAHTVTEAEVQTLADRVAAFNETSWTGVLGGYGATMSVSPRHVRVDMGFGEWHFDKVGSPFKTPYVLCLHDEEQCVRVGKDAEVPEGSPHLFNNDLDSMTFTWLMAVGTQRAGLASPSGEPPVLATIDSPVGPLDCLIDGLEAAEVDVDALESLMTSTTEESVICVDQRGLVQLSTGGMLGPQGQYTSWHAGVDDGIDEVPYRVRDYND